VVSPEVVGVEARPVHFPEPRTHYANGRKRTVSDAVELHVRTAGPIPVRALARPLRRQTAVLDYTATTANHYRFVAYEPEHLTKVRRSRSAGRSFRTAACAPANHYRLGRARAAVGVPGRGHARRGGRHEVQHVRLRAATSGHSAGPRPALERMASVPTEVTVVIHCTATASPTSPPPRRLLLPGTPRRT